MNAGLEDSGAGGLVRCAKTYTNEATHKVGSEGWFAVLLFSEGEREPFA